MNPNNRWNPTGLDGIPSKPVPFRNTVVHGPHYPYVSETPGRPNAASVRKPFPTTEMHFPRYRNELQFLSASRKPRNADSIDVFQEEEIYRGTNEFPWRRTHADVEAPHGASFMRTTVAGRYSGSPNNKPARRTGAARVYRDVTPINNQALQYHKTMYPPNYTDMWDYHGSDHDNGWS